MEPPYYPAMSTTKTLLIAFVVITGAAWAWDTLGPEPDQPISAPICTDLEAGRTVMQAASGRGDRTPAETADWLYGHVLAGCPDQLDTNDHLRDYLTGWGINPDQ